MVKFKAINIKRPCYAMASTDGKEAEITMYGEFVESKPYDSWTGKDIPGNFIIKDEFIEDLSAVSNCNNITIRMDSVGGDLAVGLFIYNKLRDLVAEGKQLKCVVDGVAMSAGSLVMVACNEVVVHATSLIMIHKGWRLLFGSYNSDELRKEAKELDAWDKTMIKAYTQKTGLSDAVITHMMSETKYMTGDEAVEKHFADTLSESEGASIAANANRNAFIINGRIFALSNGYKVPDNIPVVAASASAEDDINKIKPTASGENGGKTIMANNLEELRKENPTLASQIESELRSTLKAESETSASAAADDERKRLKEIDAIAGIYDPALVQAAKYDKPCTAQEMAYRAAVEAAEKGKKFSADIRSDADDSGVNSVPAATAPNDATDNNENKSPKALQAEADKFVHGLLHSEEVK